MKKLFFCATGAGLCLLCFFLFEPVFVYNFGWNKLPSTGHLQLSSVEDTQYSEPITRSKMELEQFIKPGVPALSLAVGINGKIVWAESRGYADLEKRSQATVLTQFRIGSTSKALTSVALGRLLDQERLQLQDSVIDYLPNYPYSSVTVKQLASHTSGIRNYGVCLCFPIWEHLSNDHYSSVDESFEPFLNDPLLFEPGTGFSYSSYNYTLLSALLERSYGHDFYTLMQKEVFEPAGMTSTTFDFNDSIYAHRAAFYDVDKRIYKRAYSVDNSNKWAGGGMISTPTDLVKLGNLLLHDKIISRETFITLTTPVELANGDVNEQHYALGWRRHQMKLEGQEEKVTFIHHGGTAVGSTALLVLVPDYHLTLAIMMNRSVEDFPLFDLAKPIIADFINGN